MTDIEQCKQLYADAFGTSPEFDKMLFDLFGNNIETYKIGETVAATFFKIPCTLNLNDTEFTAYYIYAVTTHKDFRHKGIMTKLFSQTLTEPDTLYFLKPSSKNVIPFYEQAGFKKIIGTRNITRNYITVCNDFKKLSKLCDKPNENYPIMIKGLERIDTLTFEYTLE